LKTTILGFCLLMGCGGVLSAGTITLTVYGTDSPFLSGDGNNRDYVGLPLTGGTALHFSVTGSANYVDVLARLLPTASMAILGAPVRWGPGVT
jgi:hypothetical protein